MFESFQIWAKKKSASRQGEADLLNLSERIARY